MDVCETSCTPALAQNLMESISTLTSTTLEIRATPMKSNLEKDSLVSVCSNEVVEATEAQTALAAESHAEEKCEAHTWRESGVAKVPILFEPCMKKTITGKRLRCKEIFEIDRCKESRDDGRMYLHLADGRGWVCTTARNGLSVVEPGNEEIRDLEEEIMKEEERLEKIRERREALLAAIDDRRQRVQDLDEEYEDLCHQPTGHQLSEDSTVLNSMEGPCQEDGDLNIEATQREDILRLGHLDSKALGADEAILLPSDEELWPAALGPPLLLNQSQRIVFRQIFCHFSARIADVQQDLDKISAFLQSCEHKCKLRDTLCAQQTMLAAENLKARQEWEACVKAELAKGVFPVAPPSQADLDGVVPVQVRGERWFSSIIKASLADLDDGRTHLMGPLRKNLAEARDDLSRMTCEVHTKGTECEPRKRRRSL